MSPSLSHSTFLKWSAQIISVVFYPLFIPTYGILLFCETIHRNVVELSDGYRWVVTGATFVFTCLIPFSLIIFMWKKGQIKDLYITNAKERLMPYLYTLVGYGFWCWFVAQTMNAPTYLLWMAVGATIALFLVMVINLWWKISAHLTGLGGLLGGICSYGLAHGELPTTCIIITLIISLLVMYARIYLNAHTDKQVVIGYLLGLLCTTLPNLILYA